MTRAALLHLLAAPASLSAAAVQDLEQLAQAFPYCQTAHLLLAKAAHDQGSMLTGQRLRRAATYAADRQLLRQLLEQPAGEQAVDFAGQSEVVAANNPAASPIGNTLPDVHSGEITRSEIVATVAETPWAAVPDVAAVQAVADSAELPAQLAESIAEAVAPPNRPPGTLGTDVAEPAAPDLVLDLTPFAVASDEAEPDPASGGEGRSSAAAEEAMTPLPAASLSLETPAEPDTPAFGRAVAEPLAELAAETLPAAAIQEAESDESGPLPIRPPAEAGTARFEFGLSSGLETEFTAYQLTDLLAIPAKQPTPPVAELAGPTLFVGSAESQYALSGGSRLGYALLAAPPADGASAPWAAAEPPGTVLPPVAEFFPPDALLLEHLANQPAPVPPAPSSLELIDSFLRRAPQRRRGIVSLLTVPEQADLSVRSTQAESGLASESLARILAGQGKTERAISVYERLMVRQPEKSAYFAVQIELLRNPPTPSS